MTSPGFLSVSSSQLGWVKRASWLEAVMAGPGRPRGRLPSNWVQRIAVQQAQASGEPIKIPKKRGPKPGSKVRVNRSSSMNHAFPWGLYGFFIDCSLLRNPIIDEVKIFPNIEDFLSEWILITVFSVRLHFLKYPNMCFYQRENHVLCLIQSPHLRQQAPRSLTPALCPWTTPPSPSLHYRPQQVHNTCRPGYTVPALAYLVHLYSSMQKFGHLLSKFTVR